MKKEAAQTIARKRFFRPPCFPGPLFMLFLAASVSQGRSNDSIGAFRGFGFSGEIAGFLDNLEYFTAHRVGETIFGASAKIRFSFDPSRHTSFSAGIFGLRRFGDERFITRALPLLRARYSKDRFSLTIGEIVSVNGHELPDMVYKRERMWDPGMEEGIQITWKNGRLNEDLWVSWDSLCTPNHREHFVAGSSGRIIFGPFSFPVFLTAEHFGGQLYHSSSPVRNSYAGATGAELRIPLRNAFSRIDVGMLGAGSRATIRARFADKASAGHAIRIWTGISPRGFNCTLEWYKGWNFSAPLGNPVYRSNRPILAVEVAKRYSPHEHLTMTGGIRFETVDAAIADYCRNPQYRWWLTLRGGFMKRTDF